MFPGTFNMALGVGGVGTLWTPSNLTDTPYLWMDADQGFTNLGDGGTTPGNYTATVTNITATGYLWDEVPTSVNFTLEQISSRSVSA